MPDINTVATKKARVTLLYNDNTLSVATAIKTVRTPMELREARLKECIDSSVELLGDAEVAVYYLFYDVVTEGFDAPVVEVMLHQDYSQQWSSVVRGCFV
jgi:hypothetical protein